MRLRGEKIAGYKRELFSRLGDSVKTVMELGIGTGPNLAYYGGRPSVTTVIGVDPNEKMARYAEAAAVAAGLSPAQFKFMHAVLLPLSTFLIQ
jgi:SAM-dependent methyltransferase